MQLVRRLVWVVGGLDFPVIDARRNFAGGLRAVVPGGSGVASFYCCYFACEGTAPDPLVWSAGALPKRRRIGREVRGHAVLAGPASLSTQDWVNLLFTTIAAGDVWPCSVGLSVKWVTFLGTSCWG